MGNAGSGNGWTTVIIKSDIGRKLYYGALKEGFIVENEKNPNTGAIERLTKRKMKQVENLTMTTLYETGIRSTDIR